MPDPKRALWLAIVLPGGGQIYNRKYWKLPFIYGGFLGCTYAFMWNQQMYRDYSQAYLDIMDDDPDTKSYMDMLPPRFNISGREEQFKAQCLPKLCSMLSRAPPTFRLMPNCLPASRLAGLLGSLLPKAGLMLWKEVPG